MKAFLIDANTRKVEQVSIDDGSSGVKRLIGFDTVDSDEIDDNGDRLFFDEECFLRTEPGAARFKVDNLAPVAGKGVVVGSTGGGAQLASAVIDLAALTKRVTFV